MKNTEILVVDDDRLILSAFQHGLEQAGYATRTAESGQEAIELCQQGAPDMVLLDIRMPGMSGMEVARWLREEGDIPFVFLSAYDDKEIVQEAARHGALGYLVKPVDIPQVTAALTSALARAEDIRLLKKTEAELSTALAAGRGTSTAIGIVMERYHLTEKAAFEALRGLARTQRRKLDDLAAEVIRAEETMNQLSAPNNHRD